jgi:2-polyprenyl-6-methoxyphenol hydroxylase-like FAD-dependent oxidoreductase
MQVADVAVVGGGVAGSLAALMLGRAGHSVCLIDPVRPQGAEFRCEKLEHTHLQALSHAGVLEDVLPDTVRYDGIWIGRGGRLVEHRRAIEFGIDYAHLVNKLRSLVPAGVDVRADKAVRTDLAEPTHRRLHLASGDHVDARLVVVAAGSSADALATFGHTCRVVRKCQSISIGFDLVPSNARLQDLGPLTWFSERPQDRTAYLTIFPLSGRLRANLFVYRETDDPWLREFRTRPSATLADSLPGFTKAVGTLEVSGPIRFRPVDLVDTDTTPQPRMVLVGDAFSTACPASGTGASKAMIDVERLCHIHIPGWLASDEIGARQIAQFYRDREKRASDRHSRNFSLFARRIALEESGLWAAYRWMRGAASRSRHFLPHPRGIAYPASVNRPSAAH